MIKEKKLADQILLVVYEILTRREKCSFGRLTVECFKKYPDDFSLTEYKEFPDSLKLDRPLRELRQKGLVNGSPITLYNLTPYGKKVAEKIINVTGGVKTTGEKPTKATRSPIANMIQAVEKSEHFQNFIKNEDIKRNEMVIKGLINLPMETPRERVLSTLKDLQNEANVSGNINVEKFIRTYIEYFSGIR